MRFAVAVSRSKVGAVFRALESAGFDVQLTGDELPDEEPTGPIVVFGPVPPTDRRLAIQRLNTVVASGVLIDLEARAVYRGAERVDLGSRELALLLALAREPDRVVTRDQLIEAVWSGKPVADNTVEVHVSALRRKLANGSRSLIETVRGEGYVLRTRARPDPVPANGLSRREAVLREREAAVARREAMLLARRAQQERNA